MPGSAFDVTSLQHQAPALANKALARIKYGLLPIRRAPVLLAAFLLACAASGQEEAFADLAARAGAARNANDPAGAIRLYRQALGQNPAWKEGWWLTGSLLYETGGYKEAIGALQNLLKLSPSAGPGWALLGLCEYESHEYGPALDHIRRSLALGVGNQPQMELVLRFHQAALVTRSGQFETALEQYSSFLSGEARDQQLLVGLGLLNLRRRLAPPEIPPDQNELFLLAGKAQNAQLANDRTAASAAYDELLARFPKDADVRYAYGYFLFGVDPARAVDQWRQALRLIPSHPAAHAMLSWALWLQNDQEQALNHAQIAVAEDHSQVVAQIVLGRLLAASGKFDDGIEHLTLAARLQPDNLEAHIALATACSESGRKADAQRERHLCLSLRARGGAGVSP